MRGTRMIEIEKDAVLDENQKRVVARIEASCGAHRLRVTRGHSTPQEQLAIIADFGRDHDCLFPEFLPNGPIDLKKDLAGVGLVYHWQRTWSRLLHLGVVVNPPLTAVCLEEYTRPSGEQMKGKPIFASAHITGQANGCWPIDFSSRVDGIPNFALAGEILTRAKDAGAGIKNIKIEHGNGCVHIDTLKVKEA